MGGLKRLFITVILVSTLVFSVIIGVFGSALFQEGNPLPLMVSILKLKFTDKDHVEFAKTEKQSRYISINKGNNHYKIVKDFMKSNGWLFKEQMGSGLIFIKDEKEAIVLTRQYSRHFVIWDISKSMVYIDTETSQYTDMQKSPNFTN